ncbi:hypothetical protein [Choristoneura rosaceana nucleopolyhedrovirus]|uniref:Uncharacterized protein n=1 Tax=Choristoneura rosaceana nucleopolyhedrovirus TaxID=58094 RepID=S5N3X5_9ABAC|nr:hypothetical protein [Choristoneura rosaceana nucleopolyhedrovirus]AGR57045.1 hypothetical protein [Choristoneura rosaceana nucleopolyhedrovirus]
MYILLQGFRIIRRQHVCRYQPRALSDKTVMSVCRGNYGWHDVSKINKLIFINNFFTSVVICN